MKSNSLAYPTEVLPLFYLRTPYMEGNQILRMIITPKYRATWN